MSLVPAVIVEVSDLLETAAAALVAGLGITLAFSVGIFGATKYVDLRRSGRGAAAMGAGAISALGFATSVAGVVVGLGVMIG